MEIQFENIVLRDMRESDIEDYVRWFTKETAWADWDAPWEAEDSDEEAQRKRWTKRYEVNKVMADDEQRWHFEIEYQGKHIGRVNSYLIDEHYDWISAEHIKKGQKTYRTLGIDIYESEIWGKHVGTNALRAFIQYCARCGCQEVCTQTWSGNVRMLRVAEKLGFGECDRVIDEHEVRGKRYDGLTFKLNLNRENS